VFHRILHHAPNFDDAEAFDTRIEAHVQEPVEFRSAIDATADEPRQKA